jgi:hypothetical protein
LQEWELGMRKDRPRVEDFRLAAIEHFIEGYNERAQPFVWTKTPDQVLAKAIKRQDTSDALH